MDASALDRRITLAHRVTTTSAQGERTNKWVPYAQVWAQKIEAGGREYVAGATMLAETTYTFNIRWRSDVQSTDQVTFEGNPYNINSIGELGRREGLTLNASGVVC